MSSKDSGEDLEPAAPPPPDSPACTTMAPAVLSPPPAAAAPLTAPPGATRAAPDATMTFTAPAPPVLPAPAAVHDDVRLVQPNSDTADLAAEASQAQEGAGARPRRAAVTQRIPADVLIEGGHAEASAANAASAGALRAARARSPPQARPRSRTSKLMNGGPCTECGVTQSTLFRKNAEGAPLCNACGLRFVRSQSKLQAQAKRARPAPAAPPPAPLQPAPAAPAAAPVAKPATAPPAARRARTSESPAGAKAPRRRLPPDEQRWCRYCGATASPQWRYIENELACNACALRQHRKAERREVWRPHPALPTPSLFSLRSLPVRVSITAVHVRAGRWVAVVGAQADAPPRRAPTRGRRTRLRPCRRQ